MEQGFVVKQECEDNFNKDGELDKEDGALVMVNNVYVVTNITCTATLISL